MNAVDPSGLWVIVIGIQGSLNLGGGGTGSAMIAFDGLGNARVLSGGGGGIGAEGAIGYTAGWWNAQTVDQLEGSAVDISGNAVIFGADLLFGLNDAYVDEKCRSVGPSFSGVWGFQLSGGGPVGGGVYLPRTYDISDKVDSVLRQLGLPVFDRTYYPGAD